MPLFDRLTGVLKRETFNYLLEKEIKRVARYRCFLSFALIELDRVNGRNSKGREKRADVKALGGFLRGELRETDILGRERDGAFGVILLDADDRDAQVVGERIRKSVEGFGFGRRRRTGSMGIASFPVHSMDPSDLFQKARSRLARAQAQGGNQVVLYDTS